MDESRRFLKYTIPGFALLLQVIVILYLDCPKAFLQKVKEFADIGTVVLTFFTTGIIGYIFNNIYYFIHWKLYYTKNSKLNYVRIIDKYPNLFGRFKNSADIRQREAWALINVKLKINNKKINTSYEELSGRVSSVLHSLGTTIVIMLAGLVFGFLIMDNSKLIYLVGNIIILGFLFCNYQIVAGMLQKLLERGFEIL